MKNFRQIWVYQSGLWAETNETFKEVPKGRNRQGHQTAGAATRESNVGKKSFIDKPRLKGRRELAREKISK